MGILSRRKGVRKEGVAETLKRDPIRREQTDMLLVGAKRHVHKGSYCNKNYELKPNRVNKGKVHELPVFPKLSDDEEKNLSFTFVSANACEVHNKSVRLVDGEGELVAHYIKLEDVQVAGIFGLEFVTELASVAVEFFDKVGVRGGIPYCNAFQQVGEGAIPKVERCRRAKGVGLR